MLRESDTSSCHSSPGAILCREIPLGESFKKEVSTDTELADEALPTKT